jgi:ADP-ribose pyrophosphatase YjhB (NUDIX family)
MFTHVVLAVDLACFTLSAGQLKLLLVRRAAEPFAGAWALPGGAVQADETLDAAAVRLLDERTGLAPTYLEQLYTFGDPARDPRGRTVSVAYYAVLPGEPAPQSGREVAAAEWWPLDQLPPLAFDHGQIAAYARWRLDQKLTYTPLAFRLLPASFTLGDLRAIHEAVGGQRLDPSNFTRQMLARWDLAPLPGQRDRRTRRPARLYQYIGNREIAGPPGSEQPNRLEHLTWDRWGARQPSEGAT